jgi:m7GpppX diphosphatase
VHPLNGFILLPDFKWDGKTITNLYCLAIVNRRDLQSLRHLRGNDHLELLENIRDKGVAAITEKYKVKKHELRVYVHYQPQFYHFHVHFTKISSNNECSNAERNFKLNDVINNLKIDSDYYTKVDLEYPIRRNDPIYELFKSKFE